jgi:oligopeptide/dipeptide ABC transporter ATP-binding protein
MIFQDPFASLNPRMTIGQSIAEPLITHHLVDEAASQQRVGTLLERVGLNPAFAPRFPHEFSGGQRQRVAIARAIALEPEFIVADEPLTALDVSVQAQILLLLQELQQEMGLSMLLIAHDLATVRQLADRIAVMYRGRIVELARTEDLLHKPRHPYTRVLLSSVPTPDPTHERSRKRLRLAVDRSPSQHAHADGCAFVPRCPVAVESCRSDVPPLREVRPGHDVACHMTDEMIAGASLLSGDLPSLGGG